MAEVNINLLKITAKDMTKLCNIQWEIAPKDSGPTNKNSIFDEVKRIAASSGILRQATFVHHFVIPESVFTPEYMLSDWQGLGSLEAHIVPKFV